MKNTNYITIRKEYSAPYLMMPAALLENQKYSGMSSNAKLLYTCLLNRVSLSLQSHWFDKRGYVYIFFSREEAMQKLRLAKNTASKAFKELRDADLIEEVPQRGQKANFIFVKMPQASKRRTERVRQVKEMRKDRKARREMILRRIQAAILAKTAVRERLDQKITEVKRELHMQKHITVSAESIQSIRQQVEYAYFERNYSADDLTIVDGIVQSVAEMDCAAATKVDGVYYTWDCLQGLIRDISAHDIMELVNLMKERLDFDKIKNLPAYIKGMMIRFIQRRQMELACFTG